MGRRNNGGGRRLPPRPRKRKPIRRKHPNKFVQSDIEDAERTLKWLRGEDMSRELQWIDEDKGIPTAWYAIEVLAKANGIKSVSKETHTGMDRRIHAVVFARRGHGEFARTHAGASVWTDKRIALAFASRNAIRQLLPMQPNTTDAPAWTDTKENILASELRGQGLSPSESQQQAIEAYR